MTLRRLRIFAGPNGSGKTTIFKELLNNKEIELGVYVNADDIESNLINQGSINFADYQLQISLSELHEYFRNSEFSPIKRSEKTLWQKVKLINNQLSFNTHIDSYLSADIAEFIRQKLLFNNISFTYETVMSHQDKIKFFQQALTKGYKVYLYYISTEDPEININRVQIRIMLNGHAVDNDTITKRYFKSLAQLKDAVKNTTRTYIFDNSGESAKFIAEINDGEKLTVNTANDIPIWVMKYLLN
jgi:predicted ABC-type ATPase